MSRISQILMCLVVASLSGCSQNADNFSAKLDNPKTDSIKCQNEIIANATDSVLVDEYIVKEQSLINAIKSYISEWGKIKKSSNSQIESMIDLYSFGYDKVNKVFHLCIDASYMYSCYKERPPKGIALIDGSQIAIDGLGNSENFDSFFFEKTGEKIWLKKISNVKLESDDDTFPIWNYCYDLKTNSGHYYNSGYDCVLEP